MRKIKCRGFYAKILQEFVAMVDKDDNEVQCAGVVIKIFENEKFIVSLDMITAAMVFELLE